MPFWSVWPHPLRLCVVGDFPPSVPSLCVRPRLFVAVIVGVLPSSVPSWVIYYLPFAIELPAILPPLRVVVIARSVRLRIGGDPPPSVLS